MIPDLNLPDLPPRLADQHPPEDQQQSYDEYYVQRPPTQSSFPGTDMIDRNLVILIFIVFIVGLLLGKAMNPVILRH